MEIALILEAWFPLVDPESGILQVDEGGSDVAVDISYANFHLVLDDVSVSRKLIARVARRSGRQTELVSPQRVLHVASHDAFPLLPDALPLPLESIHVHYLLWRHRLIRVFKAILAQPFHKLLALILEQRRPFVLMISPYHTDNRLWRSNQHLRFSKTILKVNLCLFKPQSNECLFLQSFKVNYAGIGIFVRLLLLFNLICI